MKVKEIFNNLYIINTLMSQWNLTETFGPAGLLE